MLNSSAYPAPAPWVETAISEAKTRELAKTRQWMTLGHWRKTSYGYVSEADGDSFFLSPHGKYDPESELIATLRGFAQVLTGDEKEHPQCRFLARRSWLIEALHLEDKLTRLPCQFYADWKKSFNAEGVSLVFASAYMNNAASMFGHTFLKFHSSQNQDDRDLLNYGVSFLAQTGDDPNPLLGLLGFYRGYFSLTPFHETLRSYTSIEGRDVWEYRLSLNQKETERLLDHLFELQHTHFDYYFIDENCSYQLLALIEAVRPDLHLTDRFFYPVIPADTVRIITRIPGLVSGIKARPSLETRFRQSVARFSSRERELVKHLAENGAPPGNETPKNNLEALDSAILYADLRSHKNTDYKQKAHRLKIQRAQAGPRMTPSSGTATPLGQPELGHDPARFGLGAGKLSGSLYQEFQFRFAYQHLLSSDIGYLPLTHLEVLRASLQYFPTESRVHLRELAILDMMSLAPIDRFEQPLSWQVAFGLETPEAENFTLPPTPYLAGGIGYTLASDSRKAAFFTFINGRAETSSHWQKGYRAGGSLEAQLLLQPVSGLKLNVGGEYRRYFLGHSQALPIYWLRLGHAISRNLELQLGYANIDGISETKAGLFFHFML